MSEMRDYEGALEDLFTVRDMDRGDERGSQINHYISHVYNKQANILFENGDFQSAINKLSHALKFNPEDCIIIKNRAGIFKFIQNVTLILITMIQQWKIINGC